MAKPTAWMPMYWGDYLGDTPHLTMAEHGAYLLLIAHYWRTGKALPDDDRLLSKLLHIRIHIWKRIRPTISAFFHVENGLWHHARIERELSVAFDNKQAASAHGRRAAAARWKGKQVMPDAMPEQYPKMPLHHHLKNHDSESLTDAARETSHERLVRLANAHRQQTLKRDP